MTSDFSQSDVSFGSLSTDRRRQIEGSPELTSQYFSSVAGNNSGDDLNPDGAPSWFRLLEIVALHNIPIVKEEELTRIQAAVRSGNFGSVEAAAWNGGTRTSSDAQRVVAIKKFDKAVSADNGGPQRERQRRYCKLVRDVMFEIEIMGRCDHPNLVKLLGILFRDSPSGSDVSGDDAGGMVCPMLVMEAADARCPDLEAWRQDQATISPDVVCSIASGVADGLGVLHSLGVVHADLKPTNVLMFRQGRDGQWQPKLADFGLSGITVSGDSPRGGSRRWNAPECLPGATAELAAYSVHPCRDIYAFGLLLFYLLQGWELFSKYDGDVDALKLHDRDPVAEYGWSLAAEGGWDARVFRTIIYSTLRRHPKDRFLNIRGISVLISGSSQTSLLATARAWFRAGKTPVDFSTFQPFGRASVSREHRISEMAGIFSPISLMSLVHNGSEIPNPLKRLLVSQFKTLAIEHALPLKDIPFGLRIIALASMTDEDQASLQAQRPDVRQFKQELDSNPFKLIGEDTDYMKVFAQPQQMIAAAVLSHEKYPQRPEEMSRDLHHLGLSSQDLGTGPAISAWQVSEVHVAAYRGNHAALANCIARGETSLCDDDTRWTPLHSAILGQDKRATKMLLKGGADVNAQLGPTSTLSLLPLHLALMLDDTAMAELLLKRKDIDIWAREYGWWSFTAAHLAAEFCEGDAAMKLLLSREKLLAKSKDVRRRTPLHRAAAARNLDGIKTLLRYGADINVPDISGITPLHKAYAAGNGFQGSMEVTSLDPRNPNNRRGQVTMLDISESEFNEAIQERGLGGLGFMNLTFIQSMAPLLSRMVDKFEPFLARCPSDHDPFVRVNKAQIMRTSNPESMVMIELIFSWLAGTKRTMPREEFGRRFHALHFPSLAVDEFELNLRTAAKDVAESILVPLGAKAPGQKGVTYISDDRGREVVYYLLDKGASAEAENTTCYTPECYAYRPSDMTWVKFLMRETLPNFEPSEACVKAPVRYTQHDGESMELPSLVVKTFKGGFSIWGWISTVVPCPNGLLLAGMGGRLAAARDAVPVPNYDVIIEVWMFPPNDAITKTRLLFSRRMPMNRVFPEPGRGYITILGSLRVKHKCRLLVNMRSDISPEAKVGRFVFSGFKLDGKRSISPGDIPELEPDTEGLAVEVGPLEISGDMSPINPKTEDGVPRFLLPRFGSLGETTNTHWRPFVEPSTANSAANPFLAEFAEMMTANWMDLSKPNRNLYLRKRIETDSGVHYGPKKMFHSIGQAKATVAAWLPRRTWSQVYTSFQTTTPIALVLYSLQLVADGLHGLMVRYLGGGEMVARADLPWFVVGISRLSSFLNLVMLIVLVGGMLWV
ncbi:hypothetical protein QQS21_012671 [Conoideocrella luteorostrata]|uniref:Protein kinase domain-containing protein n=1 Tax=Conoideocrella luteorostrata TaxID=1105319 RepID=A0AAJ0FSH4_9HYPO|nr:hypothetical protein QQS21_012671 [Conoideocrella luteorostrata]